MGVYNRNMRPESCHCWVTMFSNCALCIDMIIQGRQALIISGIEVDNFYMLQHLFVTIHPVSSLHVNIPLLVIFPKKEMAPCVSVGL